jgi:uncharacterized protein YcbX
VVPLSQGDEDALWRSGVEAETVREPLGNDYVFADSFPGGQATTAAQWFESLLGISNLSLVEAGTPAGTGEVPSETSAHFANAPSTLLLVSTASLKEFGRQCGLAVPANRFRANLEVDFEKPFAEDKWNAGDAIDVGGAGFEAAGRCVRCQAVDVDPDSGSAEGPSLLAALATSQQGASKGPTFGVLLRFRQDDELALTGNSQLVLGVGMNVCAPNACAPENDA